MSVPVRPASGEASVQKTCPSPLEDRGSKRKRDAPDDDEVVEEQKLEEKKVCKGFRHFHMNVQYVTYFMFVCLCLGVKLLLAMRDHSVSPDDHSLSESDHSLCPPGVPILKGYVAARRGEREEMQDAHILLSDMKTCLSTLPTTV